MTTPTTPTEAGPTTVPECPECGAPVTAKVTMPGEILDCPDCGAELEVRQVHPLALAVAPQVEEDWGE